MKSNKIQNLIKELNTQFKLDDISNHPILAAAEELNEDIVLQTIANVLVSTETIVKNAIENLNKISHFYNGKLEEKDIDEIAALAEEFDKSGDEYLQKQASVLDQILINFNQLSGIKAKEAQDKEIEKIREKYRSEALEEKYKEPSETLERDIQAANTVKAIDKQVKDFRPLENTLSSRTCPDHPGAQISRVGDDIYQCSMDGKIYNWKEGFTTNNGNKIPGTSINEQTRALGDRALEQMSFSTRENVLDSK